jgi:pyrroloquinoline quinone (PQQ) biosynthesis protein C
MSSVLSPSHHLIVSPRIQERLRRGELTQQQVNDFQSFLDQVEREFLQHRIIKHNTYTRWFQTGRATDAELRYFIQQFSVFSNQFLVAALLKVINSPSLQQSRASREILLNELGVIYRRLEGANNSQAKTDEEKDREGDPEFVSTEGTVDGGICRFRAAHFEWLIAVAEGLGLHYEDIGQRKHGSVTTLHFCDELKRLYGSDDPNIAGGASFAVENWAAAGFWQELEDGLTRIKQTRHPHLRLAFFTWHNRVEAQHAGHTLEELEAVYFKPEFDRAKFMQGGKEILDAIAVFWDGLESDRRNRLNELESSHG